ncbi:terpenoid synthase [Ramicandelaber brevisporus]|nr:terpenoid synthase [Ramicandelaber brevisporus]
MTATVKNAQLDKPSKLIRPQITFLLALATSLAPGTAPPQFDYKLMDTPAASSGNDILTDPLAVHPPAYYEPRVKDGGANGTILPTQVRLAEVIEMLHGASLVHDDIIDEADTRRGKPAVHKAFGIRVAVVYGDYVFFRSVTAMDRLRSSEYTEMISVFFKDMCDGEMIHLSNVPAESVGSGKTQFTFDELYDFYLKKTYTKAGTLFNHCCRLTAMLGGCTPAVVELATQIGYNLGIAFQFVDDLVDFTHTEEQASKPVQVDIADGFATAPVLFAWQEHSELGDMIVRRFSEPGDVERAMHLVYNSQGIAKTFAALDGYIAKTVDGLSQLPDSLPRNALIAIVKSFARMARGDNWHV